MSGGEATKGHRLGVLLACLCAAALLGGCTLKPNPITDAERQAQAEADLKAMFAGQEPLEGPLTLTQAFARALKYNLDRRVKLMEEAVAYDGLEVSGYDMLPKLTADAGYETRSNTLASTSVSITTGGVTVPPSTSLDAEHSTADLTFSWNLLDFGVSYFAARQNADRVLVAQEERRKVAQQLIQDVRRTFWRTASAQAMHDRVADAIRAAEQALDTSRKVEIEGLRAPLDQLRYQRTLLDLLSQLETVRRELEVSKLELAQLIALPPGQDFSVLVPPPASMTYQALTVPVAEMEKIALVRNPDLLELSYQSRISVEEVHKSILKLLPSPGITGGPSFDDNSFLVHHYWFQGAPTVSWNLISLLSAPAVLHQGDDAVMLAELRRQAVGMTILAKLHIAYQQYIDAGAEFARIHDLSGVDERIFTQVSNRAATDAQGVLERIAAQVAAVSSQLRDYESYAGLQAALARIYDTIGVDVEPENLANLDVDSLGHALDAIMAEWQKGGTGPRPAPPEPIDRASLPVLPPSATSDGLMTGVEGALRRLFGP